ncbi:hypothetical protein [Kutzneria sp. NPDC052558]|uniref:hypothetical protein n=1 Tax=Kutzneria sp. NPDC052558 TaxID=3364121 RepID=UPI0037CB5004
MRERGSATALMQCIEDLTDELPAPAYDMLSVDELDELIAGLEPIASAAQSVDD